jgi:hypothetical protein
VKDLFTWLMGEKFTEKAIDTCNWLLEVPESPSTQTTSELTVERAFKLRDLMRSKVENIQTVVEQVHYSTQKVTSQYNLKCQYRHDLIEAVIAFKQTGDIIAARLAMANKIEIDRTLPDFQLKVQASQDLLMAIHEVHARSQSKLSLLEVDLENTIASIAINDLMNDDRSPAQDRELMELEAKLQGFLVEAEDSYQKVQIMNQLSDRDNCDRGETLNTKDIDAQIAELEHHSDEEMN